MARCVTPRDAAARALAPYRQQLAPLFAKLLDALAIVAALILLAMVVLVTADMLRDA